MLLWILIISGLLLFSFGLYFLIKNKKDGKFIAAYEHCAYWGIGAVVLGVILLLEPVLAKQTSTMSRVIPMAIIFFIMLTVNSLLKATFRKKINNTELNNKRSN